MSEFPRVVGLTPFEVPDAKLAAALARAGALAVLDLGHDRAAAIAALATLERDNSFRGEYAVRVPRGVTIDEGELPARATIVVLDAASDASRFPSRRVIIEIRSVAEAEAAVAAGAVALIAVGHEAAGHVGEETTFVLVQRLAAAQIRVPFFARGGIGLHTAAAAVAGGAHGVVLDVQLALLHESLAPAALRQALAGMDGSETALSHGRRVLARPGAANDIPVGQCGAFAKPLAERFRTASNLVKGIGLSLGSHIRQARALGPLAPGGRWAAQHDLAYPIAQGPMTRVSDKADFALSVAEAGALPFLALSLLRASEARPLLEETRAKLGDRTWGVGVLGFVPPELREEQLALLREIKPPVVLIAGGRPAQAAPLEELGIATYLHVPSPGLLDLFIKDGARKFVLEGRECGGHVGPRSSFVLWESAIERLCKDLSAGEMSILFAGGVHDARSAAMVAAAAAPLAARGAKVGVLIGTAYLFTHEAVSSGAIQQAFQDEAVACRETVLLDTAPGHATRCAETDFVRAFRAEREKLEAEGKSQREVWEALENLNLGRLRIASKGLVRENGALITVDEQRQRKEGMYMLGQVAALRQGVVSMAELHAEISAGGTRLLAELTPPPESVSSQPKAPRIAIVGMAGVFPGAPELDTFWKNVVMGADLVTEVPKQRWNAEAYYDPEGTGEKTPSKWGGFLPEIPFDPAIYGIPPRSLAAIEPVQLLSLEVARRALADAGYLDREFDRERASVIFGAEAGTDLSGAHGFRAQWKQFLGDMPEELDAALPSLTEDSFPGILANVIAGRIANRLDLGGVNYTVDAACASSLAAVDVAVKELATGETDLVICGGADVHNSIIDYLMFASVHALSKTGRCRTFDGNADGIALGEAVAVVVLKRYDDAVRDGDRIYSVIEGVGGSSDGKSLGLTAPRKEGQMRALERAYGRSGISPADVELVEAHGTGTVVGDRTELATLSEVFGGAGARPGQVTLGSVKSNIGHTKCAAGLAGLIKASLAIYNRVLPPTLHVTAPNPYWDAETSPFAFRDRTQPWIGEHRRAGVSAFGFGGTNFHVVLSDAGNAAPETGLADWPTELFLLRGESRAEADATAAQLASLATSGKPYRLRDLALGTSTSGRGPVRIAFTASSLTELGERAARAIGLKKSGGGVFVEDLGEAAGGQVAFLYPGQGSQRPGMLDELFVAFPELGQLLDLGEQHMDKMFPGTAFSPAQRNAQKHAITDTRVAQPTLGMADLAMSQLLGRVGVEGAMFAGHSYGELVALFAAGVYDAATLIGLSEARAQAILSAAKGAPGTMAAVKAGAKQIEKILAGSDVVLANLNAPDQTVIAGSEAGIEMALAKLAEAGIAAKRIPVACAFHSPIVAAGAESFARTLDGVSVSSPQKPVFANTTAKPYPNDPQAVRHQLARQLAEPVRFAEQIEAMYAAGARVFVEAGPGQVLSDLVRRVLGDRPHVAVACDRPGESPIASFLAALARLATAGVALDVAPLFTGRGARALDAAAPFDVGPPATAWLVDGQLARPMIGEAPDFALKPFLEPVKIAQLAAAPVALATDSREAVVGEYLRNLRELVAGQKEVMLRLLGAPIEVVATEVVARPVATAKVAKPVAAPVAEVSTKPPLEVLIGIVSERTGYPPEMLDPDLDLEADLGIDSIKRIEILGLLGEKLGLGSAGGGRAEIVEELSSVKSLRGIAKWLEARTQPGPGGEKPEERVRRAAAPTIPPSFAAPPAVKTEPPPPAPDLSTVRRFVLERHALPAAVPNGFNLDQRRFLITDDGLGVATNLAVLLGKRGAKVEIVAERPEKPGTFDGVVHLAPLHEVRPDEDPRKALFELARAAVDGGATWIIAATGQAGSIGTRPQDGGVAAMLKSVAMEWPSLRVVAIDLDPAADPATLAGLVMGEILADDPPVQVTHDAEGRSTVRAVEAELSQAHPELPLFTREDVILVTGGARGITARFAVELAERYGCAVELVGRSPLPDDEDPAFASAQDAQALRKLLIDKLPAADRSPAKVESALQKVLAARQIRATLASLAKTGVPHRYHAVDVRDRAAFAALVDGVYSRHGRLDAVFHGAGVIEDKLLKHKTRESFDRVFDTKVEGARVLADKLREGVRYLVFFSSVSGTFGNRGQVDYSAANEALDHMAHHLSGRDGMRVVSVAWGPWAETGMVSPELEREYAKKGVGLIPPDAGVQRLFDELGRGSDAQVIFMCAEPAAMEG